MRRSEAGLYAKLAVMSGRAGDPGAKGKRDGERRAVTAKEKQRHAASPELLALHVPLSGMVQDREHSPFIRATDDV